jgi:threonine/homoserine/homoserine lactone efflux protein
MAVSSIAAFWAVAALLIVVPGADWAYVIGTVLGGRSVLLAVSGIALGYAGMTIIVAAGVGALVARTPASLIALTVAGGCYLMWLGSRTLIRPAFVSPRGSWPLAAQLGILGLVFTLSCAVFYLGMGSVIRRILIARPAVARAITRVSGAAMIVIGALLLAERLLA